MKVGKFTVQFNHKIKGYKTIEEVPYWRIYRVKRTKVKHCLPKGQIARNGKNYFIETLSEVIDKSYYNFPFNEIEWICEVMTKFVPLTKGEILVAYPRKTPFNRTKMR